MLLHLMGEFIRNETKEMQRDNTFNLMLKELGERNQKQNNPKHTVSTQLHMDRKTETYWDPPSIPSFDDDDDGWRI